MSLRPLEVVREEWHQQKQGLSMEDSSVNWWIVWIILESWMQLDSWRKRMLLQMLTQDAEKKYDQSTSD